MHCRICMSHASLCVQQSINISCWPGHSSKACWADRQDGPKDRQTDAGQMNRLCSAYYAGSAKNEQIYHLCELSGILTGTMWIKLPQLTLATKL